MTRETACNNGYLVLNYLATYYATAYTTLEVTPHEVRIHYFDMEASDEEVTSIVQKLEAIRIEGSEVHLNKNENTGSMTFDVIWPYGYKYC